VQQLVRLFLSTKLNTTKMTEKGSILIGVKYSSDNKNAIEEILNNAGASNVSTA